MLTRLRIRNFKRFDEIDIELGKSVVLIGPNNCGKTTALQALAMLDTGLKRWNEKRRGTTTPESRPGVTINRRDLISIPTPHLNQLWRNVRVRDTEKRDGKQMTSNIRIDIIIDGVTDGKSWTCGMEFDYATEETFHCRPLRLDNRKKPKRMPVPADASKMRMAYLPPMSGLAADEPKLEPGRVNVLIGEGQTAQVLRNLCFRIYTKSQPTGNWQKLVAKIDELFGVELLTPEYNSERGEITMGYLEPNRTPLDLSSSGRGLQQTLLLLAHLYANPEAVLLLDEPDAHLEILRQRQIYRMLTEVTTEQGCQIIAASHSEVILNEAADRDVVIAFVGSPHRIDGRGSQVLKSLRDISYDQYYLAEQTGWVLYLEGSTDLEILRAFSKTLNHPAAQYLARPFVKYVRNVPDEVRKHFWGLKEAKNDLQGVALFDSLDRDLPEDLGACGMMWEKREIENYLCLRETLIDYAQHDFPDDLFGRAEARKRIQTMNDTISEISDALQKLRGLDPWSPQTKVTDDFLDPLFNNYFKKLELPNIIRKADYYILAGLVPKEKIDPEVSQKLDKIVEIAKLARPRLD